MAKHSGSVGKSVQRQFSSVFSSWWQKRLFFLRAVIYYHCMLQNCCQSQCYLWDLETFINHHSCVVWFFLLCFGGRCGKKKWCCLLTCDECLLLYNSKTQYYFFSIEVQIFCQDINRKQFQYVYSKISSSYLFVVIFHSTLITLLALSSRFILPGEVDIEIPYEDFLSPDEEMDTRKEKEAKKRQELLLTVNFSK